MGGIVDLITEFIKDMLTSWVTSNLTNMFNDVNDKVGQVAVEVGKTPSTWNSSIFTMVRNISDTVMVPIAGMIISAILCYELITMIMDKNNMHDFDTSLFIRYLGKACIAVVLLSKTFDITMAIFDVGNHIVINAAGAINATATIDVEATLLSMFTNQLSGMSMGDFFILPSSIHELLVVPKQDGMELSDLEAMVQEVNATQVAPEEKLSDHVYEYDAKEKELYRADKADEHEQKVEQKHAKEKGAEKEKVSIKDKLSQNKEKAAEINKSHEKNHEKKKEVML